MPIIKQVTWIILSVVLAAVVVMAVWIMVRRYREKLRQAAEQWGHRPKMANGEFLKMCQIPDDPLKTRVALTARTVIAEFAMVPSETIWPDDSFAKDLGCLWDSVDWLEVIFR